MYEYRQIIPPPHEIGGGVRTAPPPKLVLWVVIRRPGSGWWPPNMVWLNSIHSLPLNDAIKHHTSLPVHNSIAQSYDGSYSSFYVEALEKAIQMQGIKRKRTCVVCDKTATHSGR